MQKTTFRPVGIAIALAILVVACANPAGTGTGDGSGDPATGVSGTITGTVTWSSATYVSGDLTVKNGASLTIDPGVTVTVASDVTIWIEAGATFTAVGAATAGQGITFTAASASAWRGICLEYGSVATNLEYCTVTGAGAGGNGAITFLGSAKASITHCVINGNAAGGINATDAGTTTVITGNRFYQNGTYGLVVNDNVTFDSTNSFAAAGTTVDTSNQYNRVLFTGDVSSTRTFDITEVPYLFTENTAVLNGATLTVNPGVSLFFDSDVSLEVQAGGTLSANGTAVSPVVFNRKSAAVFWRGIYFDVDAVSNTLDHCTVSGAGSSSCYAVTFASGAKATIRNCTIRQNDAGGVDARDAASVTTLTDNSFGDNGDSDAGPYDVYLDGNDASLVQTGTTAIDGSPLRTY